MIIIKNISEQVFYVAGQILAPKAQAEFDDAVGKDIKGDKSFEVTKVKGSKEPEPEPVVEQDKEPEVEEEPVVVSKK